MLSTYVVIENSRMYVYIVLVDCVISLQQEGVVSEVRNLTDLHQVVCAGPFIYACVNEVRSGEWEGERKEGRSVVQMYMHHLNIISIIIILLLSSPPPSPSVLQGAPHSRWFCNPIMLGRLARYLRETWTATVSNYTTTVHSKTLITSLPPLLPSLSPLFPSPPLSE